MKKLHLLEKLKIYLSGELELHPAKLLYPHRCPFCNEVTSEEVCASCAAKIIWVSEPRCRKCGKPLRDDQQEYCFDCGKRKKNFEEGRSLWLHRSPVSDALYRFKYQNQRVYAGYFAECLWKQFQKELLRWKPDVIVPVPVHRRRYRKRGYNQAALIARKLSEYAGIPVDETFAVRVIDTKPLKELDPAARAANLRKAFYICENRKSYRTVLLLDDIYTTGSTIHTISGKMHKKGVEKVYFLTVSIGQGF